MPMLNQIVLQISVNTLGHRTTKSRNRESNTKVVRRDDGDGLWMEIQDFVQNKLRIPILKSLNGVPILPMQIGNSTQLQLIAHFPSFQLPVEALDMQLISALRGYGYDNLFWL